MNFSDADLASIQRSVDKGRARYQARMKAEQTAKREQCLRRAKELGITVIRGGKARSSWLR